MFIAIVTLTDTKDEEILSLNTGPADIEATHDAVASALSVFEDIIIEGNFNRLSMTITKFGE